MTHIFIDGRIVANFVQKARTDKVSKFDAIREGITSSRKLTFSKITTTGNSPYAYVHMSKTRFPNTEHDACADNGIRLDELGSISIKLYKVKITKSYIAPFKPLWNALHVAKSIVVNEQHTKGGGLHSKSVA